MKSLILRGRKRKGCLGREVRKNRWRGCPLKKPTCQPGKRMTEKLQGHTVRERSFLSSLLIVCSRKESGYRLYTKQKNL